MVSGTGLAATNQLVALEASGPGCGDPAATWAAQQQFNPPGGSPFICAELYPGWLAARLTPPPAACDLRDRSGI